MITILHQRAAAHADYATCGVARNTTPEFAATDAEVTCWRCKEEIHREARNRRKQDAIERALADLSKVPDMTTCATEGLEAPCPVCHRYNAMLNERWLAHLGHQRSLMMCRDCGYLALSVPRK
jgi:hypothetical protein